MDDPQAIAFGLAGIVLATYAIMWYANPLRAIPTLGGSDLPLLSYLAARRFAQHGKEMLNEGYQKFYGRTFKVALWDYWLVVVSGPKMVEEIRRRPDDEVSFDGGVDEVIQTKYTIGMEHEEVPASVEIVRDKLTRSLPAILPDVIDELKVAVGDYMPAQGDEWVSVNAMPTVQKIIARASSRVFVGLPLCRNQEYLDLSIRFTVDVFGDKDNMAYIPKPLKYVAGYFMSKAKKSVLLAAEHLEPLVKERMAKTAEYKDSEWVDKPNDLLQWTLDHPQLDNSSTFRVAKRILNLNLAAIHTSSNSITHVLYHLAASPEYQQPLRDEIEVLVAEEGWTKATMGKMWKLDSFLKESQRLNGIALTSMTRKVLKDITLHDGTFLPKNTIVAAASVSTHYDGNIYADAETFDPFRFARMRTGEGESTKHQFVNTSTEYIPFGHGKHACPGRFFAANELKAMLAWILVNYDLKMDGDGKRPENVYYANGVIPAPKGQVMFRKRKCVV